MKIDQRVRIWVLTFGMTILLAGCASHVPVEPRSERPPPGSNLVLRSPLSVVEGLEVIVSDVVIPPGATVPAHYHPGEEFVYVLEGSAVHVEAGKPDRILRAGDGHVIPPQAVHAPMGGPDGARAIVFRVHVAGEPERIPVSRSSIEQP